MRFGYLSPILKLPLINTLLSVQQNKMSICWHEPSSDPMSTYTCSCMQAAKALENLRICAYSPEHSVLADAISFHILHQVLHSINHVNTFCFAVTAVQVLFTFSKMINQAIVYKISFSSHYCHPLSIYVRLSFHHPLLLHTIS